MFKEEGGRNSYIDEQLRLTLGDLYEPLAMVRVAKTTPNDTGSTSLCFKY